MIYIINLLITLIKSAYFFTGSYSNNMFPDPLSSADEAKYIDKLKNGDNDARNKLIEHNLRLVAHIAKKFENSKVENDDLISIGTIGLIKGIDTFSKSHGTKITTYVARCIENEILMYFRSNKKNDKNISINESIGFDKDGNEISFIDILKTPDPNYIDDLFIKDNIKLLKKYISSLSQREKFIITKRYGLFNSLEKTQKEIAEEMKISRSYVSRIEKRALTKMLREFIRNNTFD